MTSLMEKYEHDWDKVCKHYADECETYLQMYGQKLDRQSFLDWMKPTYKLSPNKKGILGDYLLYLHCYMIRKKLDSDKNQHHILLVSGKIGKGKSTLGGQIAALVDPSLNMERICYIPPHFFKQLSICEHGNAIIIDEGGNFFKTRNSMTGLGKDVSQAFQLIRDLKQLVIICYDEPEKMDKEIISKVDSMLIKIEEPHRYGNDRYAKYVGFAIKSLDKIRPLMLHEKLPHNHPKVMRHKTWIGWNSEEYPVINDITEESYRSEKRKYLRDHMGGLADKYIKDYEHISKNDSDKSRDNTVTWIKLSEAKRILPLNPETFKKRIKDNVFRGFQEGGMYFICKEDLEAQILRKSLKKTGSLGDLGGESIQKKGEEALADD